MALGQRFDRDLFNSLSTKSAAQSTIAVLDRVQLLRPEEQIAGLAAAFLLISDRYKVPAQDAFLAASNMMRHHDDRGRSEFDAVRSYLDADVFRTKPNSPQDRI
jgi:hypothetical protein